MIRFEGVRKTYLRHTALHDVTLTLPQGKIIGIVGENGSGKSTMLKLMAGLVRPNKGSVTIDGEPVNRLISKKVAYLSELDVLYPFYTAQEIVRFFASQFDDMDVKKAQEMMGFLQLDPHKKIRHMSKGQRGRLKMILALSRQVPLVLLDEPLSGLDPMVRDTIVKGLLSFIDLEHQTVIITTHEIQEVEAMLDMVVAVRDGRIVGLEDVEVIRETEGLDIVSWMKKVYGGY